MNQLFNAKQLIGKTIAQIIMPKNYRGDMWVKFTDNSFAVIKAESYQEGFGNSYEYVNIEDMVQEANNPELLELKLITEKEHEDALIAEEKKYEQWRNENNERQKKQQDEYERSILEKLKAKFKE